MIILEDMGQKEEKHTVKNQWFYENGIDVVRVPLPVGDYVIANDKAINVLERKEQRNISQKKWTSWVHILRLWTRKRT